MGPVSSSSQQTNKHEISLPVDQFSQLADMGRSRTWATRALRTPLGTARHGRRHLLLAGILNWLPLDFPHLVSRLTVTDTTRTKRGYGETQLFKTVSGTVLLAPVPAATFLSISDQHTPTYTPERVSSYPGWSQWHATCHNNPPRG